MARSIGMLPNAAAPTRNVSTAPESIQPAVFASPCRGCGALGEGGGTSTGGDSAGVEASVIVMGRQCAGRSGVVSPSAHSVGGLKGIGAVAASASR